MHISRTIALSLATMTLAVGTALAAPTAAYADTVSATGTSTTQTVDSASSWRITIKRTTNPTIQSERDRVMHDAEQAGFSTSIECAVAGDLTSCSSDSFVVTGAPYRTVLTTFRYDAAVVSIDAVNR